LSNVDIFLLCLAAILILGTIGGVLFARLGIPDALCLVAAGVILGPGLGVVDRDSLTQIAPFLGAITIIVVLFEGGSRLQIAGVLRGSLRAMTLALTGFTASSLLVAGAILAGVASGLLPAEWNWRYGLLLGVILGGSSSVVVMPAVTQARLPDSVANLVATESALTDILCVVGGTSLLAVMVASTGDATNPAESIGITFGVGLAAGVAAGIFSVLFGGLVRSSVYAYPILLALLLGLYVFVDSSHGSGALAVLIFALLVGNFGLRLPADGSGLVGSLEQSTRLFHSQVTFVIKALFFTFMGAMLGRPSQQMAIGIGLGLLLVIARVLAVRLSLVRSSLGPAERGVVTALVPRGLAAGVLATFPVTAGLPASSGIPEIVYAAVITTIVVFALVLPHARHRIDEERRASESESGEVGAFVALEPAGAD
jgi:cell volume regulation protein A